MHQLAQFLNRYRWKLILFGAGWVVIIAFFGTVDRWSVCDRCGSRRSETEFSFFPLPGVLRKETRVAETPFSDYIRSHNLRPNCSHHWVVAGSCRGTALSGGPGRDLFTVVVSEQSARLLAAVDKFLGSTVRDQWISRALDPQTAKQFAKRAVLAPKDGFSSADELNFWLAGSDKD